MNPALTVYLQKWQKHTKSGGPLPTPEQPAKSNGSQQSWRISERLTADDVASLVERKRAGATHLDLANEFKISVSSVKRLLRNAELYFKQSE